MLNILGIESSCDETAAAVYNTNRGIISNFLFSQIELHKQFGGVMPEIASRSHIEKIDSIVKTALEKANLTLSEIDVIAVTNKPGLPGSLLVGLCFAKAIAYAQNKKLIGVNHLEGHIFSAFIENPNIPFPHICLTASGGHTSIYLVKNFGEYELLGTTRDDAAGEAFDKIAKLLNLGYPGGPIIEKYAQEVDFIDFFSYPRSHITDLDLSFSGLKTAVLYDLVKKNAYDLKSKKILDNSIKLKQEVSSSLLVCIADIFEQKLNKAFKLYPELKAITFVGGVACNKYIKEKLSKFAQAKNLKFFSPSPQYCTDNGAMIAYVGHYKAQKNEFSDFSLDIF